MSNETIILDREDLFALVAGVRITAFPASGPVVVVAPLTDEAALVEGLHGTSLHVINGSRGYLVTINVLAGSKDDARLNNVSRLIKAKKALVTVSVTDDTGDYISAGMSLQNKGTRSLDADGSAVQPYIFQGVFQVDVVKSFEVKGEITADDFLAAG